MTLNRLQIIRDPEAQWGWIEERCSMPGLLDRLVESAATAFRIADTDAGVVLSIGRTVDSGRLALWIEALGGDSGASRPKRNGQILADVLTESQLIAATAGCTEMRIEADNREGWKARLLPKFGFEAREIHGHHVMTKAV